MPSSDTPDAEEVCFISWTGGVERRNARWLTTSNICTYAKQMKARFFIMPDDMPGTNRLGVFELRRCQQNAPYPGAWSLPDPSKTFELDQIDAAVMWAIAMSRKS